MKKKKFRHSDMTVLLRLPKNLRVRRTDILHTNAVVANTDIPKSKICSDITAPLQILKNLRVRRTDIPRISAADANTDIRIR